MGEQVADRLAGLRPARAKASALTRQTPVLLIQNDCILTTDSTVLEAFARSQVAEFSARALIDTATIGPLAPIGATEIHELLSQNPPNLENSRSILFM